MGDLGKFAYAMIPCINHGFQPGISCYVGAQEATKVAVAINVVLVKFAKDVLGLSVVFWPADVNAFAWLREVATLRAKDVQLPNRVADSCFLAKHGCIVCVP